MGGFDFPYTMYDVAGLLPLKIRHKKPTSIDVDCPFCHETSGKMNINFEKNVFRCNRCQQHGGMVELYAQYYGITNSQANEEIYAVTKGKRTPRVTPTPMPTAKEHPQKSEKASDQVIDQTLRTMLEMLTLADTHRRKLHERGLSDEQIARYMYRSTPAFGYQQIASRMLEMGCVLEGVPGFYQTKQGNWTLNCNPKCTGFFVPVISVTGLVQGLQIRLDHPFKGCKYIWFSSTDKEHGTSSGSPVHFVGDPTSKNVFVTEGSLKATIAHCLSGKTFLAVAGANQYEALAPAFDTLKTLGCTQIYEAYDMDKFKNEYVESGARKMMQLAQRMGFAVCQLKWNPTCKGVDDYFLTRANRGLD